MSDTSPRVEENEEQGSGILGHIPSILWQRRKLVIAPVLVCMALAAVAVMLMKPVYRSTAVLVVESQQLPEDVVNSAVTDIIDQRVARVRQQVLSRPDLITLIQRNGLYAEQRQSSALSSIIDRMRDATTIKPISADIGKSRNGTDTIAFEMSFDYEDPAKAQIVVQQYVSRFLELDASGQTEQAQNTVRFLEDQEGGLRERIAEIENRISGIKSANGGLLSSGDTLAVTAMGGLGGGGDMEIATLSRQNVELAEKMNLRKRQGGGDPTVAALKARLGEVSAMYADSHPDVIAARAALAEAEKTASADTPAGPAPEEAQIALNRTRIQQIMGQRAAAMGTVGAITAARSRAPMVMEQIAQLERESDGLRAQYNEVGEKLLSARTSARMEEEQKGERLSVTDPPAVPDRPESPNRPLIMLAALVVGLGLGGGLAFAIEFFKQPVRGVQSIEGLLGVPPLVVIPTIRQKPGILQKVMQRWHKREART